MKMAFRITFLLLLLLCAGGCKLEKVIQGPAGQNANAESADWLNELIQKLEEEKVANPPAKIYRYTYNDKWVYYLTSRCCDIPGKLYNVQGSIICEPDGGITGKGDGRCTDFFSKRSDETLIWEDKRK